MDQGPVAVAELRTALREVGLPEPHIHESVGSTNDIARDLVAMGAPDGTVIWAEEQTAGRGRRDRTWDSPKHSGIWMSSLWWLGDVPRALWGWIPLATGLAVSDAVRAHGVDAVVKWPNDVVVLRSDERPQKIAGILAEIVTDAHQAAVILGTGLNVTAAPVEGATSMAQEKADTNRIELSAAVASALRNRLDQWRHDPVSLREDYTVRCSTIGRHVAVELEYEVLHGVATGVDSHGHLILRETSGMERIITAGDVVHATISA